MVEAWEALGSGFVRQGGYLVIGVSITSRDCIGIIFKNSHITSTNSGMVGVRLEIGLCP